MFAKVKALVMGAKSYLAAGAAAVTFLAGELGWLSDAQVETGFAVFGIAFGAAIAAKGQRILKVLQS